MTVRAFFAVFPPVSLVGALGDVQQVLGAASPARGLRGVPASNWHVTLRFLGQTTAEHLATLKDIGRQVARHSPQLHCRTGGLLYLPSQQRARVVTVAVTSDSALEALATRLDTELTQAGFGPRDHCFQPHLTLARVRRHLRQLPHPDQIDTPPARFTATEFGLYRSVTAEEGARYSLLQRFPLLGEGLCGQRDQEPGAGLDDPVRRASG